MVIEAARFERRGRYLEIRSDALAGGFRAVLSLVAAGNMGLGSPESGANREALFETLGIEGSKVLGLPLRHTKAVLALGKGEGRAELEFQLSSRDGADGLILDTKDWLGSVTVADCMPIWLLDRKTGAFGILHSGWKGTGILESAIRSMVEAFGARPENLTVVLGPSIGPCCYRVSAERAAAFKAEFGGNSMDIRGPEGDGREGDESWFLDLKAANIGIASRMGAGTVVDGRICTACNSEFGSFRREGGSFTRMLALAGFF